MSYWQIAAGCALGLLLWSVAEAQDPTPDEVERSQRNFNAIQTIYRQGVPHTDKRGQLLMTYDPQRSFLQRGVWGSPLPTVQYGHEYKFETLVEGGFNTVWPWTGDDQALPICEKFGLQTVLMHPLAPEFAEKIKDHPALLGNCWMDEPLGRWDKQPEIFADYMKYREAIHKVAPSLPIFINQVPWITAPATSWWVKWSNESEISCLDCYPFMHRKARVRSIAGDPNMSIPASVGLGVACSLEKKPVWLIVGAFTDTQSPGAAFPFRFPTPEQLRACVYGGLIHGATGIIYFIWDSWIPRDGGVIGMSPDPAAVRAPWPKQEGATNPSPATPMQMAQSRACWDASVQINKEMAELTPVIFAPTVGPEVGYKLDIQGEAPTPMPIRCLLKPHPEGGYVLLTVNCDDAVLTVTYTFPGKLKSVQTLYENRDPLAQKSEDTSFTLKYEPFDTHVVRVIPQ